MSVSLRKIMTEQAEQALLAKQARRVEQDERAKRASEVISSQPCTAEGVWSPGLVKLAETALAGLWFPEMSVECTAEATRWANDATPPAGMTKARASDILADRQALKRRIKVFNDAYGDTKGLLFINPWNHRVYFEADAVVPEVPDLLVAHFAAAFEQKYEAPAEYEAPAPYARGFEVFKPRPAESTGCGCRLCLSRPAAEHPAFPPRATCEKYREVLHVLCPPCAEGRNLEFDECLNLTHAFCASCCAAMRSLRFARCPGCQGRPRFVNAVGEVSAPLCKDCHKSNQAGRRAPRGRRRRRRKK